MGQRGFLLVELLVALAVVAIVAVPLLALLTMGAEAQGRARVHTEAAVLAREKMEMVCSGSYCLLVGEEEGEVAGFGRFSRRVEVSEVWEDVKQVQVTVEWSEKGVRRELVLITFVGR
ncbi:prepilin-type N-terminal cleavage/methylation domain-containing protein [Dethiobacter alkaliphilus]|uniref:Conserved hypothetical membrane protein n=1 Tax=Dethiobacter alkaliphilus AHT 1 TaxID=555088 RepID=C0GE53_DETAL|nr:prepilin-type N-terminal cleavage/methylation domain-containing protein [Dethiobacter alkaliphilus]EEG78347.1 conserved hypothetical membrane protein [Dethiobacter alkaliphilus AHT 1]